jgi:hypothetical protein
MLDEKFRLQMESKALAQHLNALLNDKFGPQTGKGFDSDTPIDKALTFLQFIIAVWDKFHSVSACLLDPDWCIVNGSGKCFNWHEMHMLATAKLSCRACVVPSSATAQLAAHCLLAEAAYVLLPQLACCVCSTPG